MSMDFNSAINTTLTSESKLTQANGKVANFAYDSNAYDSDTVAGVEEYDYDQHQNIPYGDATTLNTDSSILNKGVRSQASSLTRQMVNHFFGRTSYNVNKLADHLKNTLVTFKNFIKEGSNEWSPTVEYKAGDVVYFMSMLNSEPCKRTFKCIVDCPSVNLPPVYTDGSLINTTYWKELSGILTKLVVGVVNSGSNNVATFNGSITVNGNITQSGTPYETHAEQIYTKKDHIILREDAMTPLADGDYSGLKVHNYDGNGTDGILAYRSDGTGVIGDASGTPEEVNLQPLLTRAEATDLVNGAPLVWDEVNKKAISGSTSGVSVITASSTVINNILLSNNDLIQILFTNSILDNNNTGGITPLSLTYNGVVIPLKILKNNVFFDLYAKEVLTNVWEYLQGFTKMELLYRADFDEQGNSAFIIMDNPVILTLEGVNIHADGFIEGCPSVGATYVQFPQEKEPMALWKTSKWAEMINYNGAFFRSTNAPTTLYANSSASSSYYRDANLTRPVLFDGNLGTVTLDHTIVNASGITVNVYTVSWVSGSAKDFAEGTDALSSFLQLSQNKSHDHGGSTNKVSEVIGQSSFTTGANGTSMISDWSHSHRMYVYTGDKRNIDNVYGRAVIASNIGFTDTTARNYVWNPNFLGEMPNYIESTNLQHNHNYDHEHNITADGGTEARPDNYTVRIWKRIA